MSIIGIDLGTTNSLVSIWENGKSIIIPNALGKSYTPSVVSVLDDGSIVVGDVAKERLITNPDCTIASFKRFMGTNKEFYLKNYKFSPEELSAFILKSLKADAEEYLGRKVDEAIISVPAYFNDSQRKATKFAGELAGLKVERLITEPTSAALAYGIHNLDKDSQLLIFDLGGGTFDVSILDFFDGVMEVKSIAGDNYLGGDDFTNLIKDYFLRHFNIDEKSLDLKTLSTLNKYAEKCKIDISTDGIGEISLNYKDENLNLTIDSHIFTKISNDLILKLRLPILRALKDANITIDDLDNVILIGGSTKMQLIKSLVSKMFKTIPFTTINPDEAVALGAAVQGYLKMTKGELNEIILTDICPYSLGIATYNNNSLTFSPIIDRGSPIPISKESIYTTIHDNQSSVLIQIYQGERRKVTENIKLGELRINVPPAPSGKEGVIVRFTYDINGLLEVETTSITTQEKSTIVITQCPNSISESEIKERLEKLQAIKIHPRDQIVNRLIIERGERIFEENPSEIRNYVSNILSQFEAILESQDNIKIEEARKNISSIFDEIEGDL